MTQISLQKVMELLGVTRIQGTPQEQQQLVQWTREFVEERGESWVRQNKSLLLSSWEEVLQLGL